jgi:hypothetical protein
MVNLGRIDPTSTSGLLLSLSYDLYITASCDLSQHLVMLILLSTTMWYSLYLKLFDYVY